MRKPLDSDSTSKYKVSYSYLITGGDAKLLKNRHNIGTSYLAKFQKRAVTNLKNYSTKINENVRKPKRGQ